MYTGELYIVVRNMREGVGEVHESISRYVVLELLRLALEKDILQLQRDPSLKLHTAYLQVLESIRDKAIDSLAKTKRSIGKQGGKILSIRQYRDYREATVLFRGWQIPCRYWNGWLKILVDDAFYEVGSDSHVWTIHPHSRNRSDHPSFSGT